jgi:hypothetical protein
MCRCLRFTVVWVGRCRVRRRRSRTAGSAGCLARACGRGRAPTPRRCSCSSQTPAACRRPAQGPQELVLLRAPLAPGPVPLSPGLALRSLYRRRSLGQHVLDRTSAPVDTRVRCVCLCVCVCVCVCVSLCVRFVPPARRSSSAPSLLLPSLVELPRSPFSCRVLSLCQSARCVLPVCSKRCMCCF